MSRKSQQKLTIIVASASLESFCIFLAYIWSVYAALPAGDTLRGALLAHLAYFTIFIAFWMAASIDQRILDPLDIGDIRSQFSAALRAVGLALVVSTVIMALATDQGVQRDFLIYFVLGTLVAVLFCRGIIRGATLGLRSTGLNVRRTLVVGSNERSARLVRSMRERSAYGYAPVGYIEDDDDQRPYLDEQNLPYFGKISQLPDLAARESIDEVLILLPVRSCYERILETVKVCESLDLRALFAADFFPLRIARNKLMYMEDIPMVSLSTVPEERARLAAKRALDLLVSFVLILILSPLFLLIATLVKTTSRGPVFFGQERVGQNRRRFKMLKFRSMVQNAEQLRAELEKLNEADGPVFKIRKDPRLTPIGGFIRKFSIDELPQLINVFVGQMSLVGPRPPLASEVDNYTWDQRRRLSVKPGMTGLWQVSGRSDVDFEKWVELDLEYIDSWSLANDFLILLKTFRAVIQGRGAA